MIIIIKPLTKEEEKDLKESQKLLPIGIGLIGIAGFVIGFIANDIPVMITSGLIITMTIGTIFFPEQQKWR